ncbi:Dibenzothiophene desulfurization enzyme C [Andreprevotia sp. IGB-42]|uniref:acyl-CoA dehydrogenase family protein n=1 Tax=Andreprevotia sp. IGB-42 TaxID=2497473 RepID=UPI00135903D3|nr:acyl-CoA dehydrogenase family protein [Andreprevotia sp. IGB-42]KAF0815321.1 Dibenzothiophene desulfurization enzyme C [Andreprevotia sp. IGB-42]
MAVIETGHSAGSLRAPDLATQRTLTVQELCTVFASTAAQRDKDGGTPKAERDLLRASGLLTMSIPVEHGGQGASWQQTLAAVREIARVDSSVAHVFAFHHLLLATARLFGQRQQWQPWFEQTVQQRWFWGNALNPLDERTTSIAHAGWREFSGQKSFCSGATDSDMLIVSALQADIGKLVIAAVPTGRAGIAVFQDWDNMGQRQTDSGSARFDALRVEEGEVLADPGPLSSPFACLRPLLAQLILANIYLGIAEGALAEAGQYTRTQSRRWHASPAASASEDLYVLAHYGEFHVGLAGARLLTDHAAALFDAAWQQDLALGDAQRGEVAVAVATAKVVASKTGLDLTSRMFEVSGARSTTAALRFDRYWRNLRVHTLHDPVDYKLRELGDWALNARYPTPSFYS